MALCAWQVRDGPLFLLLSLSLGSLTAQTGSVSDVYTGLRRE